VMLLCGAPKDGKAFGRRDPHIAERLKYLNVRLPNEDESYEALNKIVQSGKFRITHQTVRKFDKIQTCTQMKR